MFEQNQIILRFTCEERPSSRGGTSASGCRHEMTHFGGNPWTLDLLSMISKPLRVSLWQFAAHFMSFHCTSPTSGHQHNKTNQVPSYSYLYHKYSSDPTHFSFSQLPSAPCQCGSQSSSLLHKHIAPTVMAPTDSRTKACQLAL